jgi:hypothetical protein
MAAPGSILITVVFPRYSVAAEGAAKPDRLKIPPEGRGNGADDKIVSVHHCPLGARGSLMNAIQSTAQSCVLSPGTRANSPVFAVTSTA